MQNIIKVNRPLISSTHEFELGAGAIIRIDKASAHMIRFLREKFDKNPDVLSGDIRSLLAMKIPFKKVSGNKEKES